MIIEDIMVDIQQMCMKFIKTKSNYMFTETDNIALYLEAHEIFYILCFVVKQYNLKLDFLQDILHRELTIAEIARCIVNTNND